jgi:phosphoglucomutase
LNILTPQLTKLSIKSTIENASFNTPSAAKENLNIVYTSLHGTSIKAIPETLSKAGYTNVNIVPEQANQMVISQQWYLQIQKNQKR